MACVKWIKITTDMFDNRKIKYLRNLPDGNNIVLIWVMLLTMAGRCNANGMIFLTESFPYTTKMLADELGFSENKVEYALGWFAAFDMIRKQGDFIVITGWEEYQSADQLEKLRAQNRERQARFRDKQRLLLADNVTQTLLITQNNAIEEDKEEDKDIKRRRFTPPTLEEVKSYCAERGNQVDAEQFISFYESKGWMVGRNKMKDWKACVRTWEKRSEKEKPKNKFHNFDERLEENYDDIFRALSR